MPAVLPKIFFLGLILFIGCQKKEPAPAVPNFRTEQFEQYWYAGKAEISSYALTQSRYGETHQGNAVLIFVKEDFSRRQHVKLDAPQEEKLDKVAVLKMNYTKNFTTGIYPYSMLLSAFTPIDLDNEKGSLKVTMSAQEWCGHVFTQMNLRGNRYNIKSYSYFEAEGDESFSVKKVLLEDELWNLIRLDHTRLPTGEIEIISGLFFTRLNHTPLHPEKGLASRDENDSTYLYNLTFASNRTLSIAFEKNFPYKIVYWRESWTEKGNMMTTTGTLKKTLYTDYWTKNKKKFSYLRDSLELSNFQ